MNFIKKFIFKKIEIWVMLLSLILFLVILMFFGFVILQHNNNGERFKIFQNPFVWYSSLPSNLKKIYNISVNPGFDLLAENQDPNAIQGFDINKEIVTKNKNQGLLLLSVYNGEKKRSALELYKINDLTKIHEFNFNFDEIYKKSLLDSKNKDLKQEDIKANRYRILHPLILKDGSLIFHSERSPLIKTDFCGDVVWTNNSKIFHHSTMEYEDSIYTSSFDDSSEIKKIYKYNDNLNLINDTIIRVNKKNGNILYEKSVLEIFNENNLRHLITKKIGEITDPIHLNDVEPALENTKFWNKGDLFLSLRNQGMIVQFRPSTNKIIRIIKGPFSYQHDVDIINDHTISIYNNNITNSQNGKIIYSTNEILFYNFKNSKFEKKINDSMKKYNIKTTAGGLADFILNENILVEDEGFGRIYNFNWTGEKIWIYNNMYEDKKNYIVNWSRIIKDERLIKEILNINKNINCNKSKKKNNL